MLATVADSGLITVLVVVALVLLIVVLIRRI